jgi:hypothetical protein
MQKGVDEHQHHKRRSSMERFINDTYESVIKNDYRGFVNGIRAQMDEKGLAVLDDFVHPDFLEELRGSVDQLTPLCYQNVKRKYLHGSDLQNTGFWEVAFSDFVLKLSNDILKNFNVQVESKDIHPLVNILLGDQGQDTVHGWHFDATYLTIAMPVVMPPPTGERDGKFRIWPNVRQFSQSKLQNKMYARLVKTNLFQRMAKNFAINFVPGSLYFFYGFRSYHGTDDLDGQQLRANCLINFGGPFFDLDKGKVVKYNGSGS